jgi:hypothetical protein
VADQVPDEAADGAAGKRRCEAVTQAGRPCQAAPLSDDRFCAAHSGRGDMAELGRRGAGGRGLAPKRDGGGGVPPVDEEGWVRPRQGSTEASKVREPRDLHQMSEDALVDLLKSPSETARVNAAKILHERSAPTEPEPVAARAPRTFPLEDVLQMAARAGLLERESVLEALRRGWEDADAQRAESSRSSTSRGSHLASSSSENGNA